jgi:hypothetical protein
MGRIAEGWCVGVGWEGGMRWRENHLISRAKEKASDP